MRGRRRLSPPCRSAVSDARALARPARPRPASGGLHQRGRTRVSLQLQQGSSIGIAAVGRGSPAGAFFWRSRASGRSCARSFSPLKGARTRGDHGHLVLGERVAPQSEVVRAILLEGSRCWGGGRTSVRTEVAEVVPLTLRHRLAVGDERASLPLPRHPPCRHQVVLAYSCSNDSPWGLQL